MKTLEIVHFDFEIAQNIVKEMGCTAVLEQLARKPEPPTDMHSFLACFGEPEVEDQFINRYLAHP